MEVQTLSGDYQSTICANATTEVRGSTPLRSNPIVLERTADIQHKYCHDHSASAASWPTVIDRAHKLLTKQARLCLTTIFYQP